MMLIQKRYIFVLRLPFCRAKSRLFIVSFVKLRYRLLNTSAVRSKPEYSTVVIGRNYEERTVQQQSGGHKLQLTYDAETRSFCISDF